MPNPSYINSTNLAANFSLPLDKTNYSKDISTQYARGIQKVSNSKDSIAVTSYSEQPVLAFDCNVNSNINHSGNVSLNERMYKAKNSMPDSKKAIMISCDSQFDLLKTGCQVFFTHSPNSFKKNTFSQLTYEQKEYLYLFFALFNFILTSDLTKIDKKKSYEEFNDFFKKILKYKCDTSILDGTTTKKVEQALKFQKMAKDLLSKYSETKNGLSFSNYIKQLALKELYAHFNKYDIKQNIIDSKIKNGRLFSPNFNIFYNKRMLTINNEKDILMRFNNIVSLEFMIFDTLNRSYEKIVEDTAPSAPPESLMPDFQNVNIIGWKPEYRLEFQPQYINKNP